MASRLGEILVSRGVLTQPQVEQILEAQRERATPFGLLAERMFGVDPTDVELAWSEQYAQLSEPHDLATQPPDPAVETAVSKRQAWQFQVIPVHERDGELLLATTQANLARAIRFITRVLERPGYVALVDEASLRRVLESNYAIAGLELDQRAA